MLVITNNLLRDSNYGMVFRVAIGAALSTIDGVTDIYVISTYYGNVNLRGQANVMLSMVIFNICIQLLVVLGQYRQKSLKVKLREALICLLFLRPAVDALRVSKNEKDTDATMVPLLEMIVNKVSN